jgi:EpsD family peptidyl-prolyl cis-trans isomerase
MKRYGPTGSTEGHLKAKTLIITAAIAVSMTLGGCDQVKKLVGGKPAGQVVATVNGEEITSLQLRQEMGGFSSRDPKIVKLAQQQALQQIIMRRLLVQKAKADKLDKTADYNLQVRRGEEALLAQTYQRKIAATVPTPTRADAQAFIANNPLRFSGRRVLEIEQVIAPPSKISPDRFKALKTLEEVKGLFQQENVPFQENVTSFDTLTADSRLVQQIDKLPPGEVFVIPQNGSLIFNRIASSKAVPFTGDAAVAYATNAIRGQRSQDAVRTRMQTIRKDAESKIVYNAAFKPPPPQAAKPAAAAAAPAAPAAAPGPAAAPAPAAP